MILFTELYTLFGASCFLAIPGLLGGLPAGVMNCRTRNLRCDSWRAVEGYSGVQMLPAPLLVLNKTITVNSYPWLLNTVVTRNV